MANGPRFVSRILNEALPSSLPSIRHDDMPLRRSLRPLWVQNRRPLALSVDNREPWSLSYIPGLVGGAGGSLSSLGHFGHFQGEVAAIC